MCAPHMTRAGEVVSCVAFVSCVGVDVPQVPLPPSAVDVLERALDWTSLLWDDTGVRVNGKRYAVLRVRYASNRYVPVEEDLDV